MTPAAGQKIYFYRMRRITIIVSALLMVPGIERCNPASPADFTGQWEGKVTVRIVRPDGTTQENDQTLTLGILPDPDDEKALLVFYNQLPLRADLKGRSFVIRDSERQKVASLFMLLFLFGGVVLDLNDFDMQGKLVDPGKLRISFSIRLAAEGKKASLTHEGILYRRIEQ